MARPLSELREACVARSIERSQALLRDLKEMPPALKRRGQARRRPDLFGAAMRQSAPRPTPLERLMAGEFQARLALLLGVTLLVVVVITVLT